MAGRQRLDVSGTVSRGPDYTWSSIALCGILAGLALAVYFDRVPHTFGVPNSLQRLFEFHGQSESEAGQALIVTTRPGSQLSAVATLSPRGFAPLLAANKREVLSQIRTHPGTLRLAVVDATLPDYAVIARALKNILPLRRIIVLNSSIRSQDIGPMLLDRLGALQSKRQPVPRGPLEFRVAHLFALRRGASPCRRLHSALSSHVTQTRQYHA